MTLHPFRAASRRMLTTRALGAAVLAVTMAGCKNLTEVDTPNVVLATDVENPLGAVARYAGAIRSFTGNTASFFTYYPAILSDEFVSGGLSTFATDVILDTRRIPDPMISGVATFTYPTLHNVRVNL